MDRFLRLAMPFIIYFVASLLIGVAILGVSFSVVIGFESKSDLVNATKTIADMPMILYGVCTFIFLLMWMKDHDLNGFEGNEMPISMWFVLPLIGLAFALCEIYAVRGLMNQDLSEAFFGVSSYSIEAAKTLPTFFLAMFVFEPICFEFMYRGLLHQRLREESDAIVSFVIIALVTAFMYRSVSAVIFGLILSFVYEYYRNLAAPILISVSESVGVYLFYTISGSLPGLNGEMNILVPVMILLCIFLIAFLIFLIYRKHNYSYGGR